MKKHKDILRVFGDGKKTSVMIGGPALTGEITGDDIFNALNAIIRAYAQLFKLNQSEMVSIVEDAYSDLKLGAKGDISFTRVNNKLLDYKREIHDE